MRLAILGASGHGKVVADIALLLGYTDVVFFDDSWPNKNSIGSWSVAGTTQTLLDSIIDFEAVIVGIGNNRVRLEKQVVLAAAGATFVTLIHPAAVVSNFAKISKGSVICAGVVVGTETKVGAGVILNSGATVDHDCRLADGVHVAPGAHLSGDVQVGECSWIGIGACVKQGVSIGSDVMVGAGAAVINEVPSGVTVAGNPARPIVSK
jgi:sugar O-acyltransferase (sialic acid O-acetyltransferase NeuD family)